MFATTVNNGKLYILKCQAGDKRWFKGLECVPRSLAAPRRVWAVHTHARRFWACVIAHALTPLPPPPRRDLKKVQASFTVV